MDSSININRNEFETLRREVADVRHLVERTRVILHGENGDNGLRSSIERAHKAISDLRNNVKIVHDSMAQLALESTSGDKDMQLMVVQELQRLEHKLTEKEDVQRERDKAQKQWASRQRQWLIGQTVVIAFGVISVLLTVFL